MRLQREKRFCGVPRSRTEDDEDTTITANDVVPKLKMNSRQVNARQIVAYLSYALDDVRSLSPATLYLLELTIASLNEDINRTKR
jgi:hypothetical protein